MRDRHKKHKKHGSGLALIVVILIVGACVVAGCSAMSSNDLQKIAGKDTASKLEKIKDKAGKAADKAGKAANKAGKAAKKAGEDGSAAEKAKDFADKTGKAAKKAFGFADRVIEKAGGTDEIAKKVQKIISHFTKASKLDSTKDIELTSLDNFGYAYRFTYCGEKYRAVYTASCDTWTVYDSYKITNEHDITIICQALIDEHPVHGADLKSYRTADDMAYEWQQHNIVYELLPDDNRWKSSAKNVDLDPYDQGKSYKEIYEDRTGKKFDIKNFV